MLTRNPWQTSAPMLHQWPVHMAIAPQAAAKITSMSQNKWSKTRNDESCFTRDLVVWHRDEFTLCTCSRPKEIAIRIWTIITKNNTRYSAQMKYN